MADLTTIQISKAASEKLKALADSYKRSKAAHAEWLIDQDYEKLAAVKLLPSQQKKMRRGTVTNTANPIVE